MKLEWTKMTAIVIFFNIKKSKQEKERGEREEGESGKLNLKRTDVYVCYIYLCTCVWSRTSFGRQTPCLLV